MAIYLTGLTALAFWRWRALSISRADEPSLTRLTHFGPCTEHPSEIAVACRAFRNDHDPIHVTCTNTRTELAVRFHTCICEVPRGSIFRLNDRLFVVSPELALMQATKRLPLTAAILHACEACATYTFDEDDLRGFRDRPPLTSVRQLMRFANSVQQLSGIQQLRRITAHAIDNAASPRETATALILSLPNRLGGFGLPQPTLNKSIPIPTSEQRALAQSTFRTDLFWERHGIALEYDSNAFHSSPADIARDSRRRNILHTLGIEVITITNAELRSIDDTERIARLIARRLGKKIRIRTADFPNKHYELRKLLLSNHA